MATKAHSIMQRAALALDPANQAAEDVHSSNDAPKTGPGRFLSFMKEDGKNAETIRKLESELDAFKGAHVTKLIDPKLVKHSIFANRDASAFTSSSFQKFKEEIRHSGGNVQPIKVRPAPDDEGFFEIVFGHRRHRACLELDIPVLATILANVDDETLFIEMDRENRNREEQSVWDRANSYAKSLDQNLFPNTIVLCEKVGVSKSVMSRILSILKLPKVVIDAFPSPTEIKYSMVQPLLKTMTDDADGLIARAQKICSERNEGQKHPAIHVYQRLLSGSTSQGREAGDVFFSSSSHKARFIQKGEAHEFVISGLSSEKLDRLLALIKAELDT